tara:strand:- start:843 stop:1382 length:540 start_codon:yes stop_codon:yes gene_type:complete
MNWQPNLNNFRTVGRDIADIGRGIGSYIRSWANRGQTSSPYYKMSNVAYGGNLQAPPFGETVLPSVSTGLKWPEVPEYYNDPVRHPGYSGYDITQMLIGEMPQFMSELHFAQKADKASGTTNYENTLGALQAQIARNKALYGNAPQNTTTVPQHNNVATNYYSNRNNYSPGITGLIGLI